MRKTMLLVLALAAGCGGAIDARSDSSSEALRDAREQAPGARPLVGTLRMRDRDVPLTTAALEARGNEDLVRMTAQAGAGSSAAGISADIDNRYVRATGDAVDLTGIEADRF